MVAHDTCFGVRVRAEVLVALLRIALGVIFVVGGIKLAFLGDTAALVASYIDPAKGWIAPVFQDQITQRLGLSVGVFLRSQGLVEILLGLLMILGLGTRVVAVMMGLLFWSFAVANPVAGEIRLSRDIALMGLCVAVALSGAGVWSVDARVWQRPDTFAQRRDSVLLLIRLSLAYTLLASAVFVHGPFANPLTTTLPVVLVGLMGVLLAAGVGPQWLMALLFVWMLYVLPAQMLAKGLFGGLDAAKRELGFLVAALVYLWLGPDRWSWPKTTPARGPVADPTHAASAD
jgi:uncharacterized membrane protein YphA (DoxX/SURF4 family)